MSSPRLLSSAHSPFSCDLSCIVYGFTHWRRFSHSVHAPSLKKCTHTEFSDEYKTSHKYFRVIGDLRVGELFELRELENEMRLSIRRLEHLTTDWTHHLSTACFSVWRSHRPAMLTCVHRPHYEYTMHTHDASELSAVWFICSMNTKCKFKPKRRWNIRDIRDIYWNASIKVEIIQYITQ